MSDLVIVPSNEGEYTALSRSAQGRLFKKHILNKGDLIHPGTGKKIKVDDAFVAKLRSNFENGVCDIVQVPLANDRNEHSEAPDRNLGEVVDLVEENGKIYTVIDVREAGYADKMGKTLLGVSAMMHLDYTDTRTGEKVGPTLLHACVTNRPYVVGLEDYAEIVKATASADTLTEATLFVEEKSMTLEELLAQLKDEHGIDVPALQEAQTAALQSLTEHETTANLSAELVEALTQAGIVQLTNSDGEQVSDQEIVAAVAELATNHTALSAQVSDLRTKDAKTEVRRLVKAGFIVPAKEEKMVELKLSNPSLFDDLLPGSPILKVAEETGVDPDEGEKRAKHIDDEITRLTAMV